ncbi:MAG TPA: SDR family oxidoreductase [Chitinophagaceae bacterium]|nr:SDR family oxidoreductase [Chitinophagaceae bacterium]
MKQRKYVLITGATKGIGYELAKLFAADGWNIIAVARSSRDLVAVKDEFETMYGVAVETIAKDLFEPENATSLYDEVRAKGIEVEILVNNAGQGLYGEFTDTDIDREIRIIRLNVESLVILTKHFLQDMVSRGSGKILNLSSVAAKAPGPLQSVYHGTKAFVHSFTEAIRDEVKDKGVTITALLPGATDTDFFNKADMLNAKNVAEGKLADPAQVAKDGYEALMSGDDKVVSGMKNKAQVAMSNVMPDSMVAAQVHKQQEPVNKKK